MNMELLHYTDKKLKETAETFDFKNPPFDPIDFSQDLVKFMYEKNGICLTGPQIDVPYRIFAMRGSPQNFVCFNPRIVTPGNEQIKLDEVSLTYPGLSIKVQRPQHCRVRFAMPNGEIRTETYTGLTARVFQHCMDFLNGKLFYANASPFHRDQALKKWKRLQN